MSNEAMKVAKHILKDRHGADYYQDVKILTQYLESVLNLNTEEATRMARAIQDDRKCANYYEDIEVLASFLNRS